MTPKVKLMKHKTEAGSKIEYIDILYIYIFFFIYLFLTMISSYLLTAFYIHQSLGKKWSLKKKNPKTEASDLKVKNPYMLKW